jgi:hypothetical protein
MPVLTRLFIKTSLVYLALALLISLALAAQPLGWFDLPGLFPVYIHLFTMGWLTLLIFGVAYWMFPKYSQARPRGSEALGWVTYLLANLGLILRAVAEPLNTAQAGGVWGWLLAVSALAQWLAGMAFVFNTWGRVKEK